MKRISIIILSVFMLTKLVAQNSHYELKIADINDEYIYFHALVIDDSIYVSADGDNILSNNKYQIYKVNLFEGKHKISASIEGYRIIDTIFTFSPDIKSIDLYVDMKNNFHFYEFRNGFDKIYTNHDYLPIIGLKKDGNFLLRSFFHVSIVGCFQFESGRYSIEDNRLILNVNNYKSQCFNMPQECKHTYEYIIENDSISDLKKYYGFIEKKYMGIGY